MYDLLYISILVIKQVGTALLYIRCRVSTVVNVLNLNSIISYYYVQQTILSEDSLLTIITKYSK